ncbi:MAG: hypothetical protein ACK6DP_16470 [Gemmatimonas sp.]|uniref:hypothetical protein n=1 Tax=Gemmatimonas sp. TaxID=1962908 RepID=UPI00391F9B73|nr:hypothetical protein [Gemmatimonadota bacterium]
MGSWFETIGSWLFKFPPRAFARGDLVVAPVIPTPVLLATAVALALLVLVTHARLRTLRRGDRVVLGGLRTLALLLVIGCLFRPGLVIASAVPQRNVLAVLFDDSRSMRIRDAQDGSRLGAVQRAFADTSALLRTLGERFAVRRFRFAASAAPVRNAGDLQGRGTRSDLAQALADVREDLSGMPLAGVVLVSDGADNGDGSLDDALLALRARRVPVYTVGVGRERFDRDVAVERVQAPRRLLAGASSLVEADIRLRGVGKDGVTLTVEADGRVVATETVRPPARGDLVTARLRVPPLATGVHRLAVRARPLDAEIVTENNEWQTSLEVRAGPDRVLYLEGEPRPEFAFLRRAVADDSALQVVGLMRSAERKFLRLGVRDSLELISGFPSTREELFGYRALILGSVEAGFFTTEQLRMLADFVSVRGGGLLVLGGRASLAEGGFAGTPVADVLPLTIARGEINVDGPAMPVQVRPTRLGEVHPALQLRESLAASRQRWDSLPTLTIVNRLGTLRAGATLLLSGRTDDGRSDVPILSWQRYGRGQSAIFGVQDSWLWRMDTAIPVEDRTHQTFWRQMVRWLVDEAPAPFEIAATPARVAPGEPVVLRAQVSTPQFADVNDARVTVTVTMPDGATEVVPLEWALRDDGSYTARFTPRDTGRHTILAESMRGRDSVQRATTTLLVDERGADVAQAELRAPLLRRIASETGGRYYPLVNATQLANDALYTSAGVTVREANDLWDMPAVFLLLVLLLGAEWGYRRLRGLA